MTTRSPADPDRGSGPPSTGPTGPSLLSIDSAVLKDVRVALQARLGEVSVTVEDLLALKSGFVVTLDQALSDLVPLYLNGALIARGEIVAVDDKFGVRIVEVAPQK